MTITCLLGVGVLVLRDQSGAMSVALLGFAWMLGALGAWLFTFLALPWSKPPFLAGAAIFGSSFANFVSAYWQRRVPAQSGQTLRFHLLLGFAAGLALTALVFCIAHLEGSRVTDLLAGGMGGTVFALLRFRMLR